MNLHRMTIDVEAYAAKSKKFAADLLVASPRGLEFLPAYSRLLVAAEELELAASEMRRLMHADELRRQAGREAAK